MRQSVICANPYSQNSSLDMDNRILDAADKVQARPHFLESDDAVCPLGIAVCGSGCGVLFVTVDAAKT